MICCFWQRLLNTRLSSLTVGVGSTWLIPSKPFSPLALVAARKLSSHSDDTALSAAPGASGIPRHLLNRVKDAETVVFYTGSAAVLTYGPTSAANVACKLPYVCGVARQGSADAALKDHFSRLRKYWSGDVAVCCSDDWSRTSVLVSDGISEHTNASTKRFLATLKFVNETLQHE